MIDIPLFSPNNDRFYSEISKCSIVSPDQFSNYYSRYFKDSFTMIHLNIRSCRKNFSTFHVLLSSLICKFSIIALTETWLTNDIDLLFELEGYKQFNQYRSGHGGGIKLYVHDSIQVNLLNDFCSTNIFYESLVCEIFLAGVKHIICCIYRPPGTNIEDFNRQFELNVLDKFPRKNKILLCGDFNINLYNPLKLNSIKNFISLMLEYNFLSHINCPTKYNYDNIITPYSIIDQIWTNFVPINPNSGVLEIMITDHLPTFLFFSSKIQEIESIVSFRLFSKQNFEKLLLNFNSINFDNLFLFDNINDSFDYFYDRMYSAYDLSFPIKRKKKKTKTKSAWITADLKFCIKKKYKLFKMLKENCITYEVYDTYRKLLNSAVRQAKSLYYLKKSFQFDGNMKRTWNFINDLLNKNNKEPISAIKDSNSVVLKDINMVNYFNSYFINIISELTINNNNLSNNNSLYSVPYNQNSFFFFPTTDSEVENIICRLQSKPTYLTDISIDALKYISKPLSIIISHIYNNCIEKGTYPNKLKFSRVVPVFKSGSRTEVSNYRPISTLLSVNKIFEKLTYNRIIAFVDRYSLICDNQYGFRRNKGTTDAIFEVVKFASDGLNNGEFVVFVFLDLKKAFDSVSHSLLIRKLFRMGFRGNILQFLESYLSERYQSVNIGNLNSEFLKVKHGVPQGSILGPILFILFINDVFGLDCDFITLFADDAVFGLKGKKFDALMIKLQIFINSLSSWLSLNNLVPNTEKTSLMLFSFRKLNANLPNVMFNNASLKWVDNIKYLGLILDNKLNFGLQINKIENEISRSKGIIYRLSGFCSRNVLLKLYYSLVLTYGSQNILIWGGVSANKLNKIQILMNKTLRIILNVSFDGFVPNVGTSDMYKQLGLLKLKDIYCFFCIKYIHSLLYGTRTAKFIENFSHLLPNHAYNTRKMKINLPFIKISLLKTLPIYNCIKLINSLPNSLIEPQSLSVLKKKSKDYLIANY